MVPVPNMDLIYNDDITDLIKISEFQTSLRFLIEKDSQEQEAFQIK